MNTLKLETINELADAIYKNAVEKGFHPEGQTVDQFIPQACANLHGEVSELWEAHRAGTLNDLCDKADKMAEAGIPVLSCLEEELADIVIRALDNARTLGVDIQRAIVDKHQFNTTRPFKHGKKC